MGVDEVLPLPGAHEADPRILEDFRPLHGSLEWVLSRAYYEHAGVNAFVGGEVPFGATNSGRLSEDAAAILFASLENAGSAPGAIRCLEIGPGSGLFAKLLLDDLRRRSRDHGRDYYDRLTLVLADSSHAMLDAIAANNLLAEHEGHYELVHSDPLRPAQAAGSEGRLQAVFLNYVLDSLPASVLRRADPGIEQLCVRTRVERDAALEDYTTLSLAELIELAALPDPDAKLRLVEVSPALVVDLRYEVVLPGELPEEAALDGLLPSQAGETAVHSHGAIACLRALTEQLSPGGFVLVNDFEAAEPDRAAPERAPYLIYGGAIAVGLNFAQIERMVAGWPGCSFHAPADSDDRLLARMVGRELDAASVACFAERFDPARLQALLEPLERARELIGEGRSNAAHKELARALALAPRDWALHEEVSSFLAYLARDHAAARTLALEGLELNPLATGLWNVLGDCELHARRPGEALRCYGRAIELNPREVRGRYNAAYALSARRDHAGALLKIAEALAFDDGTYRERLLAKQGRIVDLLVGRRRAERVRRRDRFRPWRAPS